MWHWRLAEPGGLCLGIETTAHVGSEIQLMVINRTPSRRGDLGCCAFIAYVEKSSVESDVITLIYVDGQSSQQRVCQEHGKGLLVLISDHLSQKLTEFAPSLKNVKPVYSTHIAHRRKNYFFANKYNKDTVCLKFKLALEV